MELTESVKTQSQWKHNDLRFGKAKTTPSQVIFEANELRIERLSSKIVKKETESPRRITGLSAMRKGHHKLEV